MGRGNVLGTLKKIRNWANIFIFPKKSLPRCGCDFIKWNWKMKQILKENSNALLVARMVECATCAQARPGPPSMLCFYYMCWTTSYGLLLLMRAMAHVPQPEKVKFWHNTITCIEYLGQERVCLENIDNMWGFLTNERWIKMIKL